MNSNNPHENNPTLDQLNQDLKDLDDLHSNLVSELSKANEEIELLMQERIEILKSELLLRNSNTN